MSSFSSVERLSLSLKEPVVFDCLIQRSNAEAVSSYSVLALVNPKDLSGANAKRVSDLALQGCHVNMLLW